MITSGLLPAFVLGCGLTLHAAPLLLVRHGSALNGTVDGSLQLLSGESFSLNGSALITGDLLVPGPPTIYLNGRPSYQGTLDGAGSAAPANYQITLNGSASLRHVIRRTNPVTLPAIGAPPLPTGTRNVSLNSAADRPGDFKTVRNLTLNGGAGSVVVPPGTYGDFTANDGVITLGIAGSSQPAIYNLQRLTLNGRARLEIAGPVELAVAGGVTFNGQAGNVGNPSWLSLKVVSGGVTLNGGSALYAQVVAPNGTVIINGNSQLIGGLACDRLTINGNGLLRLATVSQPPIVVLTSPAAGTVFTAPAAIPLAASTTGPGDAVSKVEFFADAAKIGETTVPPYQAIWSNVAAGAYALTAKAITASGEAGLSAPVPVQVRAGLPYATDFEADEGYKPGSLEGQGGWNVISGSTALTASAWYHGTNSVALLPATPSTRMELSLAPSSTSPSSVVFTDLYIKPIAAVTPEAGLVLEASGARVAFVLNGDHGEFRVFQGDTFGGGIWQAAEIPAVVSLNAGRQAADWVRLTLRQDFAAKIWDISVNGALVAINLRFTASTIPDFASLTLYGQSTGTVYADYLMIGFEHPIFADADRDGMSDAYEFANGLNPDVNDRDGDKDDDGLSNIREFLLGLRADKESSFDDRLLDWDRVEQHFSLTGPTIDVAPPTAPANLAVTATTTDSIALSWAPSSDNLKVAGYQVFHEGQLIETDARITETAFLDQSLPQNSAITYQVRAYDYAGNFSPLSEPVTGRTAAVDTDGRGLPDDWQWRYFGQLGIDPKADADGDGLSNVEEFRQGTDPRDFYNGVPPIHEVLNGGNPGPKGELAMIVRRPDGTPWPNAPVQFDITSGRRRVAATLGGPDYSFSVEVRADANGVAQCYLEPLPSHEAN